jgi:hypothetical protein
MISPSSSELSSGFSPAPSSSSFTIDHSQSPSPSCDEASPEIFLTPPRETAQIDGQLVAASPLAKYIKMEQSCNTPECEILRQLLSDREKDLQHLHGKLSEAQRASEELRIEVASYAHRSAICKDRTEAPTEKKLKELLTEIEILRSQVVDKRVLAPFTTRNIAKYMPFDQMHFESHMGEMKAKIDDFMCRYSEICRPCNDISGTDVPQDLRALLHRAIGDSNDVLQSISFHSLLRSVLSAAVCEWVLECEVQEPMIKSYPLSEAMLSHLTLMGKQILSLA